MICCGLTLDQLRLFRDLAQARSISRAAELNDISQSAASQHLQELERGFELKLVDRTRRPVALTEAGRLYFDFCRDVLHRREEFEVEMDRLKGIVEGVVRIASIYSVGISEMSHLQEEFSRRWPEAELRVDYLRPEKVYLAVQADQADLGLVSYPEANKEIKVIPWRSEVMVVAVAPTHPLAARPSVAPAELNGRDFIGFDEDLPISREITRYLEENSVEVNRVMHFDNIQTMKEAVALGEGVGILPDRIMRLEIQQGRMKAIPLVAPGLFRPLGIIHRRRKKFNRAAQSFLQLLREEPAPN